MGHLNNLGFTSRLMSTIAECRGKVEEWVEHEKEAANEMERKYKETLSEEQSTIDSLEEDLLSLKFKLGIDINKDVGLVSPPQEGIAQRQQNLLEEKEQLKAQIKKLKADKEEKNEIVQRLEKEEEREQIRAAEVRAKKHFAEESKNTTVEDLTKGIINYKYLGLDFEKAENQKLRFCFSQIDPESPSKRFWFILGANDFNFYEVDECNPSIDPTEQTRFLAQLNSDDDLGQFILKMRAAFVELV